MSTARLNVWVTAVGEPCRIDMTHQWYVHVLHCDGTLLDWCGRVYTNLPTKCGHLDIDIPPGCYTVCATWSPAPTGTTSPTSLGNHISHLVVVRAECGEHVCVTLFPPTFHFCGIWWRVALREALNRNLFPVEAQQAAREADAAVTRLLDQLPVDPFTAATLRIPPPPAEPTTATVQSADVSDVPTAGEEEKKGKKEKD